MTEVFCGHKRYTDEFEIGAVRQVTEQGRRVAEVAERLGVTAFSLYASKRRFGKGEVVRRAEQDQSAEVRRLKGELRRVTEERDILKRSALADFVRPCCEAALRHDARHAHEFSFEFADLAARCHRRFDFSEDGHELELTQRDLVRLVEVTRLLSRTVERDYGGAIDECVRE